MKKQFENTSETKNGQTGFETNLTSKNKKKSGWYETPL
jgi:hypothetical protein